MTLVLYVVSQVLQLIKKRGAEMVLHPGDLDYTNRPERFEERIDAILGPDYPYFFTPGKLG